MSNTEQHPSPNGQYVIIVDSYEMRMSHWVNTAALWQNEPRHLLLELGDQRWSTEQIVWSIDSTCVTVEIRRYPGDAPNLTLDIFPGQQTIQSHAAFEPRRFTFAELDGYLNHFYTANRRRV